MSDGMLRFNYRHQQVSAVSLWWEQF